MCWSAPVSAAFACLDALAAVILWRRNATRRDRFYAAAMVLVGGQEFLQGCLWHAINTCDAVHHGLLRLLTAAVWLIPLVNVAMFCMTSDDPPPRWLRPFLLAAFAGTVLLWLVRMAHAFGDAACATVGKQGHQVWPAVDYGFLYFAPNAVIGILALPWYEPRFVVPATAGMGIASTAAILATVPEEEFASVWCWSSAFFAVYFVLEPRIADALRRAPRHAAGVAAVSKFSHGGGAGSAAGRCR
ncbi:hypothetical protein DIPPA_22047 [Diplonema papillatum]|nr:hypothetical protein DIPPA_22047 [Diplonema papillatum]|eukprot:gene6549-10003_t